jgi:hypothetical protein
LLLVNWDKEAEQAVMSLEGMMASEPSSTTKLADAGGGEGEDKALLTQPPTPRNQPVGLETIDEEAACHTRSLACGEEAVSDLNGGRLSAEVTVKEGLLLEAGPAAAALGAGANTAAVPS